MLSAAPFRAALWQKAVHTSVEAGALISTKPERDMSAASPRRNSFAGDGDFGRRPQLDSAPPALIPFVLHFLELVLESCALWAVGQVRHPFAKLVLSVPEVVAMLRILGSGGSAIPGRRRRRLTNCDLTNSRYCDLSLSVS